MSKRTFDSEHQLDSAQLQVCEAMTANSPEQFSSGMERVAQACEKAVDMSANKKQRVAFDLSQNHRKEAEAQNKHKETLTQIESMKRALAAMEDVAKLEVNLLSKTAQVKHMEETLSKEVHFSQRGAPGAPLVLHVYKDGKFLPLTADVHLDEILDTKILWVAPKGTTYRKNDVQVCKGVSVKLDAADATHPERFGFKKQGYKYTFLNAPRYKLCHGESLNLCRLLDDTWQLVVSQRNPYNDRHSLVNEFIDIWRSKNL